MGSEAQHYVTREHLSHFRDDGEILYELDKAADRIERRSLQKAGAEADIYPADVERTRMQKWDNDAHRILRRSVWGKDTIELSYEEKHQLLEWLTIYMIRTPSHRQTCIDQLDRDGFDRKVARQTLTLERGRYLWQYKNDNPERYAALVKEMGRAKTDSLIMRILHERVSTGDVAGSMTGEGVFHHMLKSGNHGKYMHHLRAMAWTWMRTDFEFVIGDNPLCRSRNGTNGWNYGIAQADVQIFFPISCNLCLRLQRGRDLPSEMRVDERETERLNVIQIASALARAWGPSVTALRPTLAE